MRPLLIGDLIAAARVLIALDEALWSGKARDLFTEAHAADLHRLASRRSHPVWGNGSLMSAASGHRQLPEPFLADARYLRALGRVIETAEFWIDAFPEPTDRLYEGQDSPVGVESDGRDTCENGVGRPGVAAHLR